MGYKKLEQKVSLVFTFAISIGFSADMRVKCLEINVNSLTNSKSDRAKLIMSKFVVDLI